MSMWYLLALLLLFAGLLSGVTPLTGLGVVALVAVFVLHIGFSCAGIDPKSRERVNK